MKSVITKLFEITEYINNNKRFKLPPCLDSGVSTATLKVGGLYI